VNVSRAEIVLRERRFWESLDVAGPMYRRWMGPIAVFFGAPFAVVVAALMVALSHVPPWVPALVIWWLKPLWDRLVMVPAGVLMFEPGASYKTMAGSLTKVISASLGADLTWRRFSPLRAYLIPVSMYERLGRREGSKRKRWLRRNSVWKLFGITWLCIGLEGLVGLSLALTFMAMSSVSVVAFGSTAAQNTSLLYNLIYATVVLCVEPFYVLASFSMYVNRRTSAEGWDLQLAFSRLRSRFPATGVKIMLAAFFLIFSLQAVSTNAQQTAYTPTRTQKSAFVERAKTVLAGNEFGRTIVRRRIRIKKGVNLSGLFQGRGGNPALNRLGAEALRIFAVAIALALIVLGVVTNRHRISWILRRFSKSKREGEQALPTRNELSNGTDWISDSRRAWARGGIREALGILYRGSLEMARTRYGIDIAESATERECLRILRDSDPAPVFLQAVEEVTGTWIRLAWAGSVPDAPRFDRLCRTLDEIGRSK